MSYKSRIPEINAGMAVKLDAALKAGAERIAQEAKNRVPVSSGKLRDAIHTEKAEDGYEVIAGSDEVFYGHIVEHGGAYVGARPFMIPALEELREQIIDNAQNALDDL